MPIHKVQLALHICLCFATSSALALCLQLKLFKGCFIVAAFSLEAQPELLNSYHLLGHPALHRGSPLPFSPADTASFPYCKHAALPAFQMPPSLLCLWAQSPAAKHTLKPLSVCSPERSRNKGMHSQKGFSSLPCRLGKGMWT